MIGRIDRRMQGLLLALAVLIVLNVVVTPNFLNMRSLSVNVSQVAPIAISSLWA